MGWRKSQCIISRDSLRLIKYRTMFHRIECFICDWQISNPGTKPKASTLISISYPRLLSVRFIWTIFLLFFFFNWNCCIVSNKISKVSYRSNLWKKICIYFLNQIIRSSTETQYAIINVQYPIVWIKHNTLLLNISTYFSKEYCGIY